MSLHNKLQQDCHVWLWNTYPELRHLSHGNINNLTSYTGTKQDRVTMSKLKAIGLVKGVLDYQFYFKGVLHVFDFKIGNDRLSSEQKAYICQIEKQGGKGYEIRSLEKFQEIINAIIEK